MRTTSKKPAIRHAFYCLGLHTPPRAVVHALTEQGIRADEELVRAVVVTML